MFELISCFAFCQVIGTYHSGNKSLQLPETADILWPGPDGPPRDTPECGYDGEFCIEG